MFCRPIYYHKKLCVYGRGFLKQQSHFLHTYTPLLNFPVLYKRRTSVRFKDYRIKQQNTVHYTFDLGCRKYFIL